MLIPGAALYGGRGEGRVSYARVRPAPHGMFTDSELALAGTAAEIGEASRMFSMDSVMAWILTEDGLTPSDIPLGRPAVAGVPEDLLLDGDLAVVEGGEGWVDLPEVRDVPVVTSFLQRDDGRILLLLRSRKVRTYRELWAGVSGYVEQEAPLDRARIEIEEETGIPRGEPVLLSAGRPLWVRSGASAWAIHPFLFRVGSPNIRLDWEHTQFDWVSPETIGQRPSVPKLAQAYAATQGARQRGRPQR